MSCFVLFETSVSSAAKVALGANPPVLQCTTFARGDVAQPRFLLPTGIIQSQFDGDGGHQKVPLIRKCSQDCSNHYTIDICMILYILKIICNKKASYAGYLSVILESWNRQM